jgi:hypothetical protein
MVEIADWLVRHAVESVTIATFVALHTLTMLDHSSRLRAAQARLLDAETTAHALMMRMSYLESHLVDLGVGVLDDHGIVYDQSPDDSDDGDDDDQGEDDSDEGDEEPSPGEEGEKGSA